MHMRFSTNFYHIFQIINSNDIRKDMKHTISILLIFLIARPIMAKEDGAITGTIIDKKTGERLPGVNVLLQELQIGAVTDFNGNFKIEHVPSGQYTLMASYIGYTPSYKTVDFNANQRLNLELKIAPKIQNLNEVVVATKSKARELREQAMPITVISMDQLSGTVNSVSDVLKRTVGVTMRQTGGVGSAARISIRGLEGKRIGFFIDETPLNDHSEFLDINDLPVDLIERIEIYKGVVPARFGGTAIGGAINIVTKEYPPRYLDAAYAIESFNTHKASTVVKRNIEEKGMELGVGGFYTYSDNDYEMTPPGYDFKVKRDRDRFEKITVGGGFKFMKNIWFDETKFEPVFIKSYQQTQGIKTDVRKAENTSQAYILANNTKKNNFLLEGLDLDLNFAYVYTIMEFVDTAKQITYWDGTTNPTESEYGGETFNLPADLKTNQHVFIQRTNLNYIVSELHAFNMNMQYKYMNSDPKDELRLLANNNKQLNFESSMNSLVTGLTYEYKGPDDKFLNALTGKHYYYTTETKMAHSYGNEEPSDINIKENDFGFSNAMRYKFRDDFMLKASAVYEVRLPSESELLGDNMIIAPSGNLKPERVTSYNLGFLLDQTGTARHNLQVELSLYYMDLKDKIVLRPGLPRASYQNISHAEGIGGEFEIKADPTNWLYGYTNVSYQDQRIKTKGDNYDKRVPNLPYFMVNGGLEFHKENILGGRDQNTRLFFDGSFIESYSFDVNHTGGERMIPEALTFDVGLEHSIMDGSLIFNARVSNLTNEEVISVYQRPLPGRNYGFKIRYLFKRYN